MFTPQTTYIALLVVQALHLLHHRLAKRHISFGEVASAIVLCAHDQDHPRNQETTRTLWLQQPAVAAPAGPSTMRQRARPGALPVMSPAPRLREIGNGG